MSDTAGLKWAPDIGPRKVMSTTRIASAASASTARYYFVYLEL